MWSRRRLAEGLDRTPAGSSKEPARVTRYLARPPTRLADEVTKWSSHDLQVCVQGKGHLVRAGWTGGLQRIRPGRWLGSSATGRGPARHGKP